MNEHVPSPEVHGKPQATGTPRSPQPNVRPFGPLVVFCCLLVTGVGTYMGYVAGMARSVDDWAVGGATCFGGVLALLAAGLWCRLMYRHGIKQTGKPLRFTVLAAGSAALIGGCVAAILHIGLRLLPGGGEMYATLGWFFPIEAGAGTGLIIGLICGHTWYRALSPITGGRRTR